MMREVQRNWTDSPLGMLAPLIRNICAKKRGCARHGLCKTLCARDCWRCPSYKCNALWNVLQARRGGVGNISKLDLPRAVRYRPRKKADPKTAIPRDVHARQDLRGDFGLSRGGAGERRRDGHRVGRAGSDAQCILTLYFKRLHFQIYMLLEEHTADCVVKALDDLQALCGKMYPRLFGLILMDRGTEFSNVLRMEHGRDGQKRGSVYFCDPLQSQQKGS